jgi:hypothetical protein
LKDWNAAYLKVVYFIAEPVGVQAGGLYEKAFGAVASDTQHTTSPFLQSVASGVSGDGELRQTISLVPGRLEVALAPDLALGVATAAPILLLNDVSGALDKLLTAASVVSKADIRVNRLALHLQLSKLAKSLDDANHLTSTQLPLKISIPKGWSDFIFQYNERNKISSYEVNLIKRHSVDLVQRMTGQVSPGISSGLIAVPVQLVDQAYVASVLFDCNTVPIAGIIAEPACSKILHHWKDEVEKARVSV